MRREKCLPRHRGGFHVVPSPSPSLPLPSSSFLSDVSPLPPIFHLLATSPSPLISFASFTSRLPHLPHLSSSLHLVSSLLASPPLHPISLASFHFSSPLHLVSLAPCLPHASSPSCLIYPPLPSLASHLDYTPIHPANSCSQRWLVVPVWLGCHYTHHAPALHLMSSCSQVGAGCHM